MNLSFGLFAIILFIFSLKINAEFTPDWTSLDSRENPKWYDQSKFGIFVHWGVYSVIGRGEWLWQHWKGTVGSPPDNKTVAYMNKHYPAGTTYAQFAHQFLGSYILTFGIIKEVQSLYPSPNSLVEKFLHINLHTGVYTYFKAHEFTAEEFDADEFAKMVKASGARYLVLTSKHHEGYTLYPSRTSFSWNSVDIGPGRDLVNEVAQAIRRQNIHFGLYFSQYEWFHPLYLLDFKNETTFYPDQISVPQMYEITQQYQPEIIWSDGEWDKPAEYWQAQKFIAWLFNQSPVKDQILVNDRWGWGTMGHHGSFLTGGDRWMPGHLIKRKWEYCMTLDQDSWGYRRDMTSEDVYTIREVLADFVSAIAWGGNIIINVAPNRLGRVPPIFEERLREIGKFVDAYSEAIFESKPWIYQNESVTVWYTSKLRNDTGLPANRIYNPQDQQNTVIYAFVLDWDESGWVDLGHVRYTSSIRITLLGTDTRLRIMAQNPLIVMMPPWQRLPYREVAVLKIEYALSSNFKPIIRDI